jgi:hypothetical protein
MQNMLQPTFGKVVLAPPTSTEGMPKVKLESTMPMFGGNGGKNRKYAVQGYNVAPPGWCAPSAVKICGCEGIIQDHVPITTPQSPAPLPLRENVKPFRHLHFAITMASGNWKECFMVRGGGIWWGEGKNDDGAVWEVCTFVNHPPGVDTLPHPFQLGLADTSPFLNVR